jgi:hypothetical protein
VSGREHSQPIHGSTVWFESLASLRLHRAMWPGRLSDIIF